eukprot:10577562-Lingulodinium_polyedra.AAC.1
MSQPDFALAQYRTTNDLVANENATLRQKVQRLETLVDQLQDEVKNHASATGNLPDDRTDDGDVVER